MVIRHSQKAAAWAALVDPIALHSRLALDRRYAAVAAARPTTAFPVEHLSDDTARRRAVRPSWCRASDLESSPESPGPGLSQSHVSREASVDSTPGAFYRRTYGRSAPLTPRAARELGEFGVFRHGYLNASAHAKLEHLSIALAAGQTQRAKAIFFALEAALGYDRASSWGHGRDRLGPHVSRNPDADLPTLREVAPVSVHASFIRRFYVDAIRAETEGQAPAKAQAERDALEWLHNLRDNGPSWGEADHNVIASALKGILQLRQPTYGPLDLFSWITASRDSVTRDPKAPTLANIFSSIVFTTTHESYMGSLSAEQAAQTLRQVAKRAGRQDLLEEVDAALIASAPVRLSGFRHDFAYPEEEKPRLDPVTRPFKSDDHPNATPEVPMRLGHLLANVSTISDSSRHVHDAYERQLLLENAGYAAAQAEWYDAAKSVNQQGILNEPKMKGEGLQQWMWTWHKLLTSRIHELAAEPGGKEEEAAEPVCGSSGAFYDLLPAETLSKTIIVEVLRSMGHRDIADGAKTISLYVAVGKAVESEWQAHILQRVPGMQKRVLGAIRKARSAPEGARGKELAVRRLWQQERSKLSPDMQTDYVPNWSLSQKARIGAAGVKLLNEVARVERATEQEDGSQYRESQPAFFTSFQYLHGRRVGVLKLNDLVATSLERDPADVPMHPRYLPMLAQPLPWIEPEGGAYLVHGAPFMRFAESVEQFIHVQEAHKSGGLEFLYRGLDKLGSAAWTINRRIFQVMAEVWNSGQALAGIPVRDPHLNIVDPAAAVATLKAPGLGAGSRSNPKARAAQREIFRALLSARRSAYGQRCSVNYQLEIARAFLGETFYFPHNIDFRGRAYPIPANLNHIGNDISRSLLTFAERRRLGKEGLRWLKIHLANKAGYDKASLTDRVAYAESHQLDIFDSADRPLDGKKWWLQSDDPWQTLAACIELTEALRHSNPQEYESSLPVHQDGSCNGLQHYAALGGDIEGGREVNLIAGERPGDVYSKVAAEVGMLVEADARSGHEVAMAIRGRISRKIVKQTVMTTVYGVTFVGAREQIKRQLKDLHVVPIPQLFLTASYVASLVLRSIGTVFAGATAIQEWLTHAARLVSKSVIIGPNSRRDEDGDHEEDMMTSMTWTTPLGLVVCQPYRKTNKTQVQTLMQTVYLQDPGQPGQADSRSQASAFPPNFIHSLDATHMILTALSCQGLTFAAVHDSFWTHAADVDKMNEKLRVAFVRLHEAPILENLAGEVRQRFAAHFVPRKSISREQFVALHRLGVRIPPDVDMIPLAHLLPPLPRRGHLDVREVLSSPYFFS